LPGTIVLLRRIKVSFTGDIKLAGASGRDVVERVSRRLAVEKEGLLAAGYVVPRNVRARMRNVILHVFGTWG